MGGSYPGLLAVACIWTTVSSSESDIAEVRYLSCLYAEDSKFRARTLPEILRQRSLKAAASVGGEKIPKEDLPAPSSVSAAFPASWLLLEYEKGYPAGLPHLHGTRIFKSQTDSDRMMYNTCKSIAED